MASSVSGAILQKTQVWNSPTFHMDMGWSFFGMGEHRMSAHHFSMAGDLYSVRRDLTRASNAYLNAIANCSRIPERDEEDGSPLWTKYFVCLWKSSGARSELSRLHRVRSVEQFNAFVCGWERAFQWRLKSEDHLSHVEKDKMVAFQFYANVIAFLMNGSARIEGVEKLTALFLRKIRDVAGKQSAERYFLKVIDPTDRQKALACARAWDLSKKIRIGGLSPPTVNDSRKFLSQLAAMFRGMKMFSVVGTYESRLRMHKTARRI